MTPFPRSGYRKPHIHIAILSGQHPLLALPGLVNTIVTSIVTHLAILTISRMFAICKVPPSTSASPPSKKSHTDPPLLPSTQHLHQRRGVGWGGLGLVNIV